MQTLRERPEATETGAVIPSTESRKDSISDDIEVCQGRSLFEWTY
jgi:hypothetical protein